MLSIQLKPDQVLAEVSTFNHKLAEGIRTLRDVGDIPTGVTEREVVYQEDKLTLYRYKNPTGKAAKNKTPLLICYALVNRPYMTDIQEDRSTVRGLMNAGQDVYLIDWGYPDRSDRFLTLDDYINGYLDRCIDVICARAGVSKINLLGVCQGGVFSLCYASLHPEKVRNLITMVTLVDFHAKDNMLSQWIRNIDVDLLVDTMGNVSGDLMNWTFLNLKPYQLIAQKYINMVDILDDQKKVCNFMAMEKWVFDSPDQAGEAYRSFVKQFYQDNGLVKGTVKIGDHTINLKNVKCPVLNVFAEADHLAPPSGSRVLGKYVGTKDYSEISFKGGHIGIYVSGSAQALVPPSIGKWLTAR